MRTATIKKQHVGEVTHRQNKSSRLQMILEHSG